MWKTLSKLLMAVNRKFWSWIIARHIFSNWSGRHVATFPHDSMIIEQSPDQSAAEHGGR